MTEKSLKIENQKSIVKESIYNFKGRIESVKRKISTSGQISERNRELIFDFCEHRRLQGLSNLRILFYLNRFWNIAREYQDANSFGGFDASRDQGLSKLRVYA